MTEADLVILGAGPAGLAAAKTALARGRAVTLLDEQPSAGGQIWRGAARHVVMTRAVPWLDVLKHPGLDYRPGTSLIAASGNHELLLRTGTTALRLRYRQLILATGARERFLPFPGWTLPGVLGVGALQLLAKSGLDLRGKRVVLAGTSPLLLAAASSLCAAGADVALIAEQAPWQRLARFAASLLARPRMMAQALSLRRHSHAAPYRCATYVTAAHGDAAGVREVELNSPGGRRRIECDFLAASFGLVPNPEPALALGCALNPANEEMPAAVAVDEQLRTSVADVFAAGEITGVGGVEKSLLEGELAAASACGDTRAVKALLTRQRAARAWMQRWHRAFALDPALRALAGADTVVCRCEQVRLGDLAPMHSFRAAKLATRCGMGACQGRVCGAALTQLRGFETPGARPPLQPIGIGALIAAFQLNPNTKPNPVE